MDCIGFCTHTASVNQMPISPDHVALHRPSGMIKRSTRIPTWNFWKGHRRSVKVMAMQVSADTPNRLEGGHMREKTLYEFLGISQGSTTKDIKTAYRKLARQFHPDACVSQEKKHRSTQLFLKIHDAYSTLSHPHDRAQYDRQLMRSSTGRAPVHNDYKGRSWETDQCW
eukprot:Gb_09159 [translate_table: standard]